MANNQSGELHGRQTILDSSFKEYNSEEDEDYVPSEDEGVRSIIARRRKVTLDEKDNHAKQRAKKKKKSQLASPPKR